MENQKRHFDAITVTLNPAIDRTLVIPDFTAGVVNRVSTERLNPGGKGVNVAAALADYGYRVAATGFLGDENDGIFGEFFSGKGIEDRFMRIPGRTRVGFKVTDPVKNQTTDINFPGLSPKPDAIDALIAQLDGMEADYYILGGSVPPGVDPAIYDRLTRLLKTRGKVVLDASSEPLRLAMDAVPQWVKPNIHELEALIGQSLPDVNAVIGAARNLITRGIEMAVISMGREGACFVTQEETIVALPPEVEVKSTVGAGDAMVAGIVAGKLAGLALPECARLATAFSLDVLTSGSPGLASKDAIREFMNRVTITRH